MRQGVYVTHPRLVEKREKVRGCRGQMSSLGGVEGTREDRSRGWRAREPEWASSCRSAGGQGLGSVLGVWEARFCDFHTLCDLSREA